MTALVMSWVSEGRGEAGGEEGGGRRGGGASWNNQDNADI